MVIVSILQSDKCPLASSFCYVAPEPSNVALLTNFKALSMNYISIVLEVIKTVTGGQQLQQATNLLSGFAIANCKSFPHNLDTPFFRFVSFELFSLIRSSSMAFRPKMCYWKTLLSSGFRGGSEASYTTSSGPKMKAYAPAADYGYIHHQHPKHGKSSMPAKGDFVPVYVAIGMIALSTGLGLHTAWQQLRNSPTVRVKKQRRETLPEVVEPEHVVEEADKFKRKSFFRKVAHVQEHRYPNQHLIPDPLSKDAYAYSPRVETLKSVGVDPSHV